MHAFGEDLPYPDDHFDLVFSNEVIEHVDDDRATLREVARGRRDLLPVASSENFFTHQNGT